MVTIVSRLKKSGLFVKIFIVMVVSIIASSVIITYSTLRMSERLFMDTFSITNSKILTQIKTNLESYNGSIGTAMSNMIQKRTIKSFLTENDTNSLAMTKSYYNMHVQMKGIQSQLDTHEVGITVIGVNGRNYSTYRS